MRHEVRSHDFSSTTTSLPPRCVPPVPEICSVSPDKRLHSLQLGRFLCGVVFSEEMAIAVDIPNVFLRPPRCNGRKKAVGQIAHSKAGTKLKRRQILTHCVIKYC